MKKKSHILSRAAGIRAQVLSGSEQSTGNRKTWDRILEMMISHARSICYLFLTQVFRQRQSDIIACENYHTFQEYGPWARIPAAGERMWDLFFTEVLNLEISNF